MLVLRKRSLIDYTGFVIANSQIIDNSESTHISEYMKVVIEVYYCPIFTLSGLFITFVYIAAMAYAFAT